MSRRVLTLPGVSAIDDHQRTQLTTLLGLDAAFVDNRIVRRLPYSFDPIDEPQASALASHLRAIGLAVDSHPETPRRYLLRSTAPRLHTAGPVTGEWIKENQALVIGKGFTLQLELGVGGAPWTPIAQPPPEPATTTAAIAIPTVSPLPKRLDAVTTSTDSTRRPRQPLAYAGIWRRMAAGIADGLLVTLASVAGLLSLDVLMSATAGDHGLPWPQAAVLLIVFSVTYGTLFESGRAQGTPGQRAFGLLVVGNAGYRISRLRALGRNVSVWLLCPTLGVAGLLILTSRRRQALWDRLAGTFVVTRGGSTHDVDPAQPPTQGAPAWAVTAVNGGFLLLLLIGGATAMTTSAFPSLLLPLSPSRKLAAAARYQLLVEHAVLHDSDDALPVHLSEKFAGAAGERVQADVFELPDHRRYGVVNVISTAMARGGNGNLYLYGTTRHDQGFRWHCSNSPWFPIPAALLPLGCRSGNPSALKAAVDALVSLQVRSGFEEASALEQSIESIVSRQHRLPYRDELEPLSGSALAGAHLIDRAYYVDDGNDDGGPESGRVMVTFSSNASPLLAGVTLQQSYHRWQGAFYRSCRVDATNRPTDIAPVNVCQSQGQ